MRKTILILLTFSSFAFSNFNNFSFNYSISDLRKAKIYSEIGEDLKLNKFQQLELFNKYGNNLNFKKGIYALSEKDSRIKEMYNLSVPNYIEAIDLILKDSNLLSSYTAFKLLQTNFLMKGNIYGKKVLRKTTRELYIHKFPLGMLWYAKSYTKQWSNKSLNYKKAVKILEETKAVLLKIKKENRTYTEEVTLYEVFTQISKTKAWMQLRDRVESGKTIKIKRVLKGHSK